MRLKSLCINRTKSVSFFLLNMSILSGSLRLMLLMNYDTVAFRCIMKS